MLDKVLWWWNSTFTYRPKNGIVTSRLPLQDSEAMTKTFYRLGPNALFAATINPSGLTGGYAPTTGAIGISTVNDAMNVTSVARAIQPSGTGGAIITNLPSDQLLATANVLEPGR